VWRLPLPPPCGARGRARGGGGGGGGWGGGGRGGAAPPRAGPPGPGGGPASHDEAFDWLAWLADEQLVLDIGALAFWSWWVTPDGMHKRFDTRFFVAEVPAAQAGVTTHDTVEITDSRWLTPQAALAAQEAGEVVIIFPTRRNLEVLGAQPSAVAAIAAAREGRTDRRRIQPRMVAVGQVPMVQHPYEDTPHPV
jgi:hypothetical protein